MAPHRFVQQQMRYNNNYSQKGANNTRNPWLNGSRTITFSANDRNDDIGWQEPRKFSRDWNNSPVVTSTPMNSRFYPIEEQNDFYGRDSSNNNYSEPQNVTYNMGRKLNNFQNGRNNNNNIFQDYREREFNTNRFQQQPLPLLPQRNNYAKSEYSRNDDSFFENNDSSQSFYKKDYFGTTNNSQNSYYDDQDESADSSNWFSFESDTQLSVNVRNNHPNRGRGRGRGRGRNNSLRRNFKKPFARKPMFKKPQNKPNRGKIQPKKIVNSKFSHILEGFEIKPNQSKAKVTENDFLDPNLTEEYLIIDQTGSTNQDNTELHSSEQISNSDTNESQTEETNGEERKAFFCDLCNVYCLSSKNFETHNQSNNHRFKADQKAPKVKAESETNEIQVFDVDSVDDDSIKMEENNISVDDADVDDDDEVVEIGNVDGVVKSGADSVWNPDTLFGKQFLVQFTGFYCRICKKMFKNTEAASNHCRSLVHFEKCQSLIVKVES